VRRCNLSQLTLIGRVIHGRRRGPGRTLLQAILQLDMIPSILFNRFRRSALCQKARIDLPQAFLEVSQPDKDDTNIDESKIGDNRENVNDQLLSEFQFLHVDGIQPTFSTAADSEEESVDRRNIVKTSEYRESHERTPNDVEP
jgi:hypothetical protein